MVSEPLISALLKIPMHCRVSWKFWILLVEIATSLYSIWRVDITKWKSMKNIKRTAFTVDPLGFYEFNRLLFGLANAPASYQRLMEECLGVLNMKICFIYLDDLIISKTFDEHMYHLEMVFQRLQEANLKSSTKKCVFLKKKVKFVGHIVSDDGIEPDPDKIEVVVNWPKPDNPEKVRQFLDS